MYAAKSPGAFPDVATDRNGISSIGLVLVAMGKHEEAPVEYQQAAAAYTLSLQPSPLLQSNNAGAARGGSGNIIVYIFL